MSIRHVLLDADGVLQELPGGWVAALKPWLGTDAETFLRLTVEDEQPALRGEEDFLVHLARRLHEHGTEVTAEELFWAVWTWIEVAEGSMALVHRLHAERWHLDEGYDALLARLGRHGVALPGTTEVCGERLPR